MRIAGLSNPWREAPLCIPSTTTDLGVREIAPGGHEENRTQGTNVIRKTLQIHGARRYQES